MALIHRIAGSPRLARARMAAALPRLVLDRDSAMRPLRAALADAARGTARPEERRWIERIEGRRRELAANHARTDLPMVSGGGKGDGPAQFDVAESAATVGGASTFMSLAPEWALLLMRLVRESRPGSCLELGTGFGISSSYIGAALELNGAGQLRTLEGLEDWATRAEDGLSRLNLGRVGVEVGPLAQTLPVAAAERAPLDLVFIDAEHQRQPTIDHFATVSPHLAPGALVVFDDANWKPVRSAYREIRKRPEVSSAIAIGRLAFCAVAR
ncbi:MAG TPA: class I SAM-dependent methyltransferase [Solirubrobacterales bacterium]|nr:class I SAM-dependent methyltransferase [Solirubrobacterales bacterium]